MNYKEEEIKQISEKIQSLAQEKQISRVDSDDFSGKFPGNIISFLQETRVFEYLLPREMGGKESIFKWFVALEEIAFYSATAANIMTTQSMPIYALLLGGSEKQKKEELPKLVNVNAFGCFALTEPKAGSDVTSVKTFARKTGDGFSLTGQKSLIANAEVAELFIIIAREEGSTGRDGFSLFLVRRDAKGLTVKPRKKTMGIRGIPVSDLELEEVIVPFSDVIGRVGEGWQLIMSLLNKTRPGVGALSVGLARAALNIAAQYSKKREQFGRPLAKFQSIKQMLAEMAISIELARTFIHKVGLLIDRGNYNNSYFSSIAKVFSSDVAVKVTNDALQILGGYGYLEEYKVERLVRDARITQIYDGANEVLKMIVADEVLKGN